MKREVASWKKICSLRFARQKRAYVRVCVCAFMWLKANEASHHIRTFTEHPAGKVTSQSDANFISKCACHLKVSPLLNIWILVCWIVPARGRMGICAKQSSKAPLFTPSTSPVSLCVCDFIYAGMYFQFGKFQSGCILSCRLCLQKCEQCTSLHHVSLFRKMFLTHAWDFGGSNADQATDIISGWKTIKLGRAFILKSNNCVHSNSRMRI